MFDTPQTIAEVRTHKSSVEVQGTGWIILADTNVAEAVLLVSQYRQEYRVFGFGKPYHEFMRANARALMFAEDFPQTKDGADLEQLAVSTSTPLYLEVDGTIYRVSRSPSIFTNRPGCEDCYVARRNKASYGQKCEDGHYYVTIARYKAEDGELLRSYGLIPASFPMESLKQKGFLDE